MLFGLGNAKLGRSIFHFSLQAVETCPGRTPACTAVCYANGRGRFRFPSVREKLAWCYDQSRRPDFASRVAREIASRGVIVLRVHASGDFYDREYAEKWLDVMRRAPRVRYYFYTRSWRVPAIDSFLIFSWSIISPVSSDSGRGGQPGT